MKPEPLVQTSAGMETATQTVERIKKRMEPIKADKLGTTPAFVPPPAPSKDAALTRLESSITPPEPSQQPQQQPNLRDSLVTRQLAALEKLGTRGARTQEVMEDQQVLQRQQALDATDRNIATRERYYENRLRNLEDKGGGLKIGLESETNTIRRERARELADLYIIRAGQNQEVETARQYANDLIAAEFEPLKEEMQYTSQLYTMLANDLTDSEKLQVQQQMTEKNNNIAYAQQTSQQIYNELINSGAYTPERGQILKDAMAEASLAIQNGQSPQAAIAKMQSTMQGVQTLGQLQMEAQRASIRASNASAALNEAELIAYNRAQQDAAKGILSGEQVEVAQTINKDFEDEPIVKAYNEGLQKYIVLEDTLANGIDGVQDLQLVYDFMKSVDPTSVVREAEFDNAAKTGNIFQGAYAKYNKSFGSGGFLPPAVKDDFIRSARASFEAKNTQYNNVKAEKARQINQRLGINNGADYLTAYENAAPLNTVDFGIADSLSGATPEDIADIMLRTEGFVGANIYGK